MKRYLQQYLLEILIALTLIVGGFLITTHSVNAVQEQRINSLESAIEQLRAENREDHKQIMEMLRVK